MAVYLNPITVRFASSSCMRTAIPKSSYASSLPSLTLKSRQPVKHERRSFHIFSSENDYISTDSTLKQDTERPLASIHDASPPSSQFENGVAVDGDPKVSDTLAPKKAPLTAREKLRAARVLSRYSETKATKSEMGSKVMEAIREVEKGKKGLPEAPTNIFDDSKRGMPKKGLTFSFPGGVDLFIIVTSFVVISTVMFATTFIVWKVGAIHFNE